MKLTRSLSTLAAVFAGLLASSLGAAEKRAPADVVDENRRRLKDYQDQADKLTSALERLK